MRSTEFCGQGRLFKRIEQRELLGLSVNGVQGRCSYENI